MSLNMILTTSATSSLHSASSFSLLLEEEIFQISHHLSAGSLPQYSIPLHRASSCSSLLSFCILDSIFSRFTFKRNPLWIP
ncbi:hypothetical protein AMELA_G00071060 [Ameiurus melas]|uniref:Uncharacterized protein n=1 Tax=Ameiurus melas TaxID=219545 RepID=A0A7J6AX59_AMEME|nr:hypothetical protein AMELA_G00071060 [Ameiurus melas]